MEHNEVANLIHLIPRLIRKMSSQYTVYSAYDRPELYRTFLQPGHPLSDIWPKFVEKSPVSMRYWHLLHEIPYLSHFQFIVCAKSATPWEHVIAYCNSIPFFWEHHRELSLHRSCGDDGLCPECSQTLPDGGWEEVLRKGMELHIAQSQGTEPKKANTLSALGITILPEHRRKGIAEDLLELLKDVTQRAGLESLVVPLRPTLKARFVDMSMTKYMGMKKKNARGDTVPFDPWLRKHVSLGAQIVKVAPRSMYVEGDLADWQDWTGRNLREAAPESSDSEDEGEGMRADIWGRRYWEVEVPGALAHAKVYPNEGVARYTEPNIWVQYNTAKSSKSSEV